MRWADELGAISEEPGILVRRFGTDAMRRANDKDLANLKRILERPT